MSNSVFANKMEISCKAGAGKIICAMPDTCFTPPLTPATPPGVPVPYPNTAMSSDCTDGSTSVKIAGEEIMLKDQSYFKTSTGDEAGSAPKKGVVTSVNKGKAYIEAHSMDVVAEGENVDRHLDISTNNHASKTPGQTAPMPETEAMAVPPPDGCDEALAANPVMSHSDQQARCKSINESLAVEDKYQSHHVIGNSHFSYPRKNPIADICPGYSEGDAPCVALQGASSALNKPHGVVTKMQKDKWKTYCKDYEDSGRSPTYAQAREDAKTQLMEPHPGPGMTEHTADCVLKEVDRQFEKMCTAGMQQTDAFKLRPPGRRDAGLPKIGPLKADGTFL